MTTCEMKRFDWGKGVRFTYVCAAADGLDFAQVEAFAEFLEQDVCAKRGSAPSDPEKTGKVGGTYP